MRHALALAACLSLLGLLGSSGLSGAGEGDPLPEPPPQGFIPAGLASFDDLFEQGLALFRQQDFTRAQEALSRAHAHDPDDIETNLLLGISLYRTKDYDRAEPLLAQVVQRGDSEVQASARVFLGLIYQSRGAADRARIELERANFQSKSIGASTVGLIQGLQPHLLSGTFVISPEFDGNVQLNQYDLWSAAPGNNADGDVLLIASLTLRPIRRIGLYLVNTLSYRQQFRFQDYNLLLDTATLGYNFLGDTHRVRVAGYFSYALLGQNTLYLEGGGRVQYRLRLWSKLGLLLSYDGHYRDYTQVSYLAFTGHTHTLAAELNWGLSPAPLSFSGGYQAIRDQLVLPPPVIEPDRTRFQDDYRAWAHGPLVRMRAQVSPRVELGLSVSLLRRVFDHGPDTVPPQLLRRQDWYLFSDLSVTVSCTRWMEFFAGSTLIYNDSTNPSFSYLKPTAYLGLAASFSVL